MYGEKILNKEIDNLNMINLVYCENDLLLNNFKKNFIDKFVAEDVRDFNLSYVENDNCFVENLIARVNTLPVGTKKRFIIAKTENYFIKKSAKDNKLIGLFNNFPETSCLLMLVKSNKVDFRTKLNKTIKKNGEIIKLDLPKYNNLDQWIKKRFQSSQKRIDQSGVKFLEHMFNNRLLMLDQEIEKTITHFYEKDYLTLEDLQQIISKDRLVEDREIFNFLDMIGEKKKERALISLKEMYNDGLHPLQLLASLTNQVELLMQVKFYKNKGKTANQIAKIISKHPFPIKKAYQRTGNFSEKELENILEALLKANLALVTGKYDEPNLALEMFILASV